MALKISNLSNNVETQDTIVYHVDSMNLQFAIDCVCSWVNDLSFLALKFLR